VAAAFQETIDAGATQTIHAGLTQTIDGGLTQTIDGGETRSVSGGVTETINGSRTQTINGSSTESISASQTQAIAGSTTITSAGAYTVKADGSITLQTAGPMNMMATTWTMLAPGGQTNLDNFNLRIASEDWKFFATQFQPNAVAINAAAIAIGAIGERMDIVTTKREVCGIVIQNKVTDIAAGEAKKRSYGASIAIGFLMFL
jgi:type VI secretion system secreted protein VgrG